MERRQLGRIAVRLLPLRLRHAAHPEDQALDRLVGEPEAAEILAAHHGRRRLDAVRSEALREQLGRAGGEGGSVERRGRIFLLADRHDRHAIIGHPGRDRLSPHDALDAVEQQLARRVAVAAHREQHLRFIRDDVVLGAGVEAADGHHRGALRIVFAADQSLKRRHDPARKNDRVLGRVWVSAVAADPLHRNGHAIDVRQRIAIRIADRARREARGIVKREHVARLGEARVETVGEHRLCPLAGLLAGLEDHDERAGPLVLHRGEPSGRAHPRGHVRVVAAGVHDAGLAAGAARAPHLACER